MLQESAKKANIAAEVISLERQSWGAGEPCGPPLPAQQPVKALDTLYRERLRVDANQDDCTGFHTSHREALQCAQAKKRD
jgi:hypothetical protein